MITTIIIALRSLAGVAPLFIKDGKADQITTVLNLIATLGERQQAGEADLKALCNQLKEMNGVTPEVRAALWAEIDATHAAIQDAVKDL